MTTNQSTGRRVKVSVTLTIDVDVDEWGLDYGTDGPAEVRADVRRYAADAVLYSNGAIKSVAIRPTR